MSERRSTTIPQVMLCRLPQFLQQFAPALIAMAIGAVITFLVGVSVARLAQGPPIGMRWSILNDHYYNTFSLGPAEYFEEKSDSEWLELYQAESYGFRVRDLRYYNADDVRVTPGAVVPTTHPQHLRRRFVTEVGFPAFALRTESSAIGGRFAIDHPEGISDARIVTTPGRWHYRLLWRGFLFNTLLAASLLLAFYVFVRGRRCCYARPIVVICACAGLWLSVLIAWAAFWFHQNNSMIAVLTQIPSEYESHVKTMARPAEEALWDSFSGTVARTLGARKETYYFSTTGVTDEGVMYVESVAARGFRHRLGWPFYCLDTNEPTDRPPYTGVRLDLLFRLPVAWPGLLANWVFYTLLVLGIFLGPIWMRRRRRLNRGCCMECGYPRGSSPVCTECGSALGGNSAPCSG